MPSAADLANFNRLRTASQVTTAELVPKVPDLPEDVRKRFPSLKEWEQKLEEWRIKTNISLRGGQGN